MKTSKIILFSYVGLLATAFLVFVIVLRAADQEYREVDGKYTTIKKELPDFKYIHIEGQYTNLVNSDSCFIDALAPEKSNVKEINFSVLNDTLFICPTNNVNTVSVFFPKRSNLYLVNYNARINLVNVNADTLNYIGVENSEISDFYKSTVGYVDATVKDSRFYAYQGSITKLNLNAEKSAVNIRGKMSAANVVISNNSEVRLGSVDKINLEKDESSKFFSNP